MKKYTLLIFLSLFVVSCTTSKNEIARIASPDGKVTAVLVTKEKTETPLPGPEPPRTKARWIKLTVSKEKKVIYETEFEEVGVYQRGPFAFDLAWSPNSKKLAYRMLNSLRIIGINGKVNSYDIIKDNALISSFKWLNNKELLIVSKGVDEPLDMYGYPVHYHGYLTTANYVRIRKLNINSGLTECFKQDVKNPTFIFHSIGFKNDEISPYSSSVAYSDGSNICIYDDVAGKIIAQTKITGSLEGIWWINNNELVLGIGLLSGKKQFFKYRIGQEKTEDITKTLLPYWDGLYQNSKWFEKNILKEK